MRWFEKISQSREPDFVVGGRENPYMQRWWVIPRNPLFNIYLHRFLRSDDDEALHDHPWLNVSYLLDGEYIEYSILAGGVTTAIRYKAGNLKFRRAKTAHRIEIDQPCWSLFITGPIVREWGFHCPKGWRHWKVFTDGKKGTKGIGCS
jgi:hypothetical protein